ncbi:hypothetical protein HDU81_006654 [Chytriomyces hyalinus]|nr:hypothetical protein HDU81_006654 [Chytriomyces hyalinus]
MSEDFIIASTPDLPTLCIFPYTATATPAPEIDSSETLASSKHLYAQSQNRSKSPGSRSKTSLQSNADLRIASARRLENHVNGHWEDIFKFSLSILPVLAWPIFAVVVWAGAISAFSVLQSNPWKELPSNSAYVMIITIVLNLLLAFRTSAAYDRYAEGRKLWSKLYFHIFNLARYVTVYDHASTAAEIEAKHDALHLLSKLPSVVMDQLRAEPFKQMNEKLNSSVPDVTETEDNVSKSNEYRHADTSTNTPGAFLSSSEILQEVQTYIFSRPYSRDVTPFPFYSWISKIQDQISQLDRVKTTPSPLAYTIHLYQATLFYLGGIPFVTIRDCGPYLTVIISAIVAFVFLGMLAIADEIEQPFGDDVRDLPLEKYCAEIEAAVEFAIERDRNKPARGEGLWGQPCGLIPRKADEE